MRMETHERSKSGSQGLTLCGWGNRKGQNPAEVLADGQTQSGGSKGEVLRKDINVVGWRGEPVKR